MVLGCSKWLGVRLEVLCSLLVTLVAAGAVLVTQIPGLILNFCMIEVFCLRLYSK